jgi:hypothetical protein
MTRRQLAGIVCAALVLLNSSARVVCSLDVIQKTGLCKTSQGTAITYGHSSIAAPDDSLNGHTTRMGLGASWPDQCEATMHKCSPFASGSGYFGRLPCRRE